MSDVIRLMPPELAALATGPEWMPGTFGDSYREIGRFRIYVYPGVDVAGDEGWEMVVSYRWSRGRSAEIVTADLHTTSELVRQIEAVIATLDERTLAAGDRPEEVQHGS